MTDPFDTPRADTLPANWRDEGTDDRPCARCSRDGARRVSHDGRRVWLCESCFEQVRRR